MNVPVSGSTTFSGLPNERPRNRCGYPRGASGTGSRRPSGQPCSFSALDRARNPRLTSVANGSSAIVRRPNARAFLAAHRKPPVVASRAALHPIGMVERVEWRVEPAAETLIRPATIRAPFLRLPSDRTSPFSRMDRCGGASSDERADLAQRVNLALGVEPGENSRRALV